MASPSKSKDTAAPFDGAPLIVEHVSQRFGDFDALTDVSLSVARGHIGVIIGGSGAGKTTLLRVLIGLAVPTCGRILIEGQNIVGLGQAQLRQMRRRFGMVFQHAALLDSLTIFDNVALPLREHTRAKPAEIQARVREMLLALDLKDVDERLPGELSGGMRKRVGIARALILKPSILLYDEPTSGLDPLGARAVDELIVSTRDRFGVTSLVISHDMAEAQTIADRVYVLNHGRLEAAGTVAELRDKPGGLAAQFFAASLVGGGPAALPPDHSSSSSTAG